MSPFACFLAAWMLWGAVFWSPPPAAAVSPLHLTLMQCVDIALSQNRDLLLTKNSLAVREMSLDAAATEFDLKYFPAVDAGAIDGQRDFSAGVTVRKKFTPGPALSFSPRAGTLADNYTGEIGLSLDVPLFRNFGKAINLDGIRSSAFAVRSADRSVHLAQSRTILATVSAVYRIVGQNERVNINRNQVERLKRYAALSKAKERVNLASSIDVYRSLIRLRDAENRLSVSLETLDEAYDELKIIMALPLEREIRVQAPLDIQAVEMTPGEALETAMENRVEIAQGQDALSEAQRRSRLSKQRIWPDVSLRLGYTRYGVEDDSAADLTLGEDTWRVVLTSSSDLFRTTERIGYRQSLYEVESARLNLQSIREGVQKEVRRELALLEKALERIEIGRKQIHEARGKLVLAEIKFDHGLGDNFDMIEAETELQQAQVGLVATRIDYIVGRYRLREVLGTLAASKERFLP